MSKKMLIKTGVSLFLLFNFLALVQAADIPRIESGAQLRPARMACISDEKLVIPRHQFINALEASMKESFLKMYPSSQAWLFFDAYYDISVFAQRGAPTCGRVREVLEQVGLSAQYSLEYQSSKPGWVCTDDYQSRCQIDVSFSGPLYLTLPMGMEFDLVDNGSVVGAPPISYRNLPKFEKVIRARYSYVDATEGLCREVPRPTCEPVDSGYGL